ncbi:hypothetical protein OIDMADRAFT_173029 [Oidiodendron maius Zn]|uniref:2EXR domain-containing protein n=1 Tax=Oidiodendron maius (strain Zn) TaxID=913774 RepID=A0A0C3GUD8_OIDMZ|nr:hypothetical protein OIDMADRAFT_173029 [Oidiodendron maius Zn]
MADPSDPPWVHITDKASPTFPAFPLLPTEIRLRVWTQSLLPRVLELHSPQAHYADQSSIATDHHSMQRPPAFQSRSYNPAALSVNVEARTVALTVYTVALPLAPEKRHGLALDGCRVLYISPDRDTVVLLGYAPSMKVTRLVSWFREHIRVQAYGLGASGLVTGLCSIGVSAAQFTNNQGAQLLRIVGRELFYDVDCFILVIGPGPGCGTEQAPPDWWDGGKCLLRELSQYERDDEDQYRVFQVGVGRQFRGQDGWMVVGRNRMRIASIYFENGW